MTGEVVVVTAVAELPLHACMHAYDRPVCLYSEAQHKKLPSAIYIHAWRDNI